MKTKIMDIFIPMEHSGIVRDSFIALGHNAMSCDLLPTDKPGPHYQGDVYDILFSRRWDLIIAHPECTKLCVSGNGTYAKGKPKHHMRLEAIAWTWKFWDDCKKQADAVCFENPRGVLTTNTDMPKPQRIQPYMFGHMETKETCLFLHNLPELIETNNVKEEMDLLPAKEKHKVWYASPGPDRWKERSKTFQGIADAMADRWGQMTEDY